MGVGGVGVGVTSVTVHVAYSCRIRGGKGCKLVGGGRRGERKQAGTAWFDLDAVFGFGPED